MREEELIPGLPDEIALDCLVRVPYRFHSALKSVCRGWKDLLAQSSFYHLRSMSHKQESMVCLVQAIVNPSPTTPADHPTESESETESESSEKEKTTRTPLCPPVYGLTIYNAAADTWHRMPTSPILPTGIPMFCQCVAVSGKLVVIGGWDPTTLDSVADVYVYDFIRGGGWRRGSPMSVARSFFACAAVGSAVYVAGGHDNHKNALRSAEMYDVDADTWIEIPPMAEERDECQGLSCGDARFWVVSGYGTDRQGRFDSGAECYDPELGAWTQVDGVWPFPNASPRGSCCEIPQSKQKMSKLTSLPFFPSSWFVGTSSNSSSIGNYQGLSEYDEREKKWKVKVPMPESICSSPCATAIRSGSSCCVDGIFVIGSGGDESGPNRFRGCVLDMGSRKWLDVDTPVEFSGFVYSASSICL